MLELDRVSVRYRSTRAMREASLVVQRGEIVALLGANCAGKSTTLKAIMGLVPLASGDVRFDGVSIAGQAPEAIVRRGISLVPEGRQILQTLTVEENLALGELGRSSRATHEWTRERVLERFPALRDRLPESAGALSGGQQQQLAIARALVADPRLLMLDEPTFGLAPRVIDGLFESLIGLRAEGVTVLLVEQNAVRALGIADRAYVMAQGSVAERQKAAPHVEETLVDAYLGGSARKDAR
jgi:branched-chain amino acid transport system ATP-binding protein